MITHSNNALCAETAARGGGNGDSMRARGDSRIEALAFFSIATRARAELETAARFARGCPSA